MISPYELALLEAHRPSRRELLDRARAQEVENEDLRAQLAAARELAGAPALPRQICLCGRQLEQSSQLVCAGCYAAAVNCRCDTQRSDPQ